VSAAAARGGAGNAASAADLRNDAAVKQVLAGQRHIANAARGGFDPAADRSTPQGQASLRQMLTITWKKGPDLPQGFQDSSGGIIGSTLITVAGFGQGQKGVSGKPNRYPRGFLKRAWGLDLSKPEASWNDLPEFPGPARQGLFCAPVTQELYCWGGISYTTPFTYRDGYRLSKQVGRWVWEPLPDLPSPAGFGSICAIGTKIYILGGADYNSERFYTHADRAGHNNRLGARLLMIDAADLRRGWKHLADCPGTPRWVAAMAAVKGKVFVIGGATGNDNPNHPDGYNTVVDNWRYDPARNQWNRLRDLPVASGNFPSGRIVYEGRYILLIGGNQYPKIENTDGSLREPYGVPYKHYKEKDYFSDVWVYDTHTGLFGTASPLPINNNMPMAVLEGSTLYLIGGETGGSIIEGEHFGHHPDLFLVGSIERTK
jgi:N-acetylneuraminic acid mutarotase